MLCGLDQLMGAPCESLRRRLRSSRVGVLTHGAAVDRDGRQTLSVLAELGVTPSVVFSPEHGFHGHAQAEEAVPTHIGPAPSLDYSAPVISLYGDTKQSLSPVADLFSDVDLLLVDLVDVGCRYYTYVWTALLAARAARSSDVHCVVLDRANPVSGDAKSLEGAAQQAGFLSFVGLEPLPIRHALTIAEILAHFVERDGHSLGPDDALSVVPTQGWERLRTAAAWNRPFVPPSPNMPTLETALVYPGGCLIEGTNLSEGRGTTTPFQVVGAPFLDGAELVAGLQEIGTPGALLRPITFRPCFDKHAHQPCSGVMIHVTNSALFRPVATYLSLVTLARRQAPEQFAFRTEAYEFETEMPAFDLLTGSNAAREAIIAGASPEEVVALVAPVNSQWTSFVSEAEARLQNAQA